MSLSLINMNRFCELTLPKQREAGREGVHCVGSSVEYLVGAIVGANTGFNLGSILKSIAATLVVTNVDYNAAIYTETG